MEEKECRQLADNYFREFCCNMAEGNEAPVGGKASLRKNSMTQKGWQ